MTLPRYVALKSKADDLYLKFIKEDGEMNGYVKYDARDVVTSYTKYEMEPAKASEGYVNIRCCYNNKYWVCPSKDIHYVVAAAHEPNEDKSNWACTLFEPIYDSNHGAYRIKHVYLGYNTCSWRDGSSRDRCLSMRYSNPDHNLCDLHIVVDWESFFILPKHVAFKGDNGKYLKAYLFQDLPYLQFSSNDIGEPGVQNEVTITSNGSVRIQSIQFGKFWRLSPTWIWADSTDTTANNKDTLFWPVKVDINNIVALRNSGNNCFCKRLTTDNKEDCLNAADSTITRDAHMEIQELVLLRRISNVNFNLLDARIYGETVMVMATNDTINLSNEEKVMPVKLSYKLTESSSWSSTVSAKFGVTVSIQTDIPLIVEGKIEISTEFSGTYEWGATRSKSCMKDTTYQVPVPPMSRMKVSLLATLGHCDIPFSYFQHDTLMNGEPDFDEYDDGIYTVENYYNFKYETEPIPI